MDKKKLRSEKVLKLAKKGGQDKDLAILDAIFELEDRIEAEIPEIKNVIKRVQGEKGEPGRDGTNGFNGKDGLDGKDGVDGQNGKDGLNATGKDGRDGRNGQDGLNGTDGRDGRDGKDGKDAIFPKDFGLKLKQLERIPYIERMAQINSLPVTTSFFNGLRGKNMTIVGATAVLQGDTVNITVSGTGGTLSASNFVFNEVPSGSGTGFTLANTPTANTVQLFRGGALQQPGVGNDYTISGGNITLALTLQSGEILLAHYLK